jgi:acyl-CoA dehydrogenase
VNTNRKKILTEAMRDAVNDAMDVHSGKAVIDGPRNYLAAIYRALPIGITVEGANIVTRSLIVFGQGAIRAHPHLLDEIRALGEDDPAAALEAFDRHLWAHVGHAFATAGRAALRAWTRGAFVRAPGTGAVRPVYRQASRWAAAFALTVEVAFLTLGGGLKRREMISARLGDVLSDLYFISAVLKRWEDDGRPEADLPLVEYAAAESFERIGRRLDAVLANLPGRVLTGLARAMILPGARPRGPDDALRARCGKLLYEPSEARDRIVGRLFEGCARDGIALLNSAYGLVTETEPLRRTLRETGRTAAEAVADGTISEADRARLDAAEAAVAEVVRVDDFSPAELARYHPAAEGGDRTPEAAA